MSDNSPIFESPAKLRSRFDKLQGQRDALNRERANKQREIASIDEYLEIAPSVEEALDKLSAEDAGLADLVKMRFFVGLTNKEAAEILGVSEPTVERRWAFARAWLYREIQSQ